jgi:hypothetical protein
MGDDMRNLPLRASQRRRASISSRAARKAKEKELSMRCDTMGFYSSGRLYGTGRNHLVWLDMEMTGLDPERSASSNWRWSSPTAIETIAESPVWVVHQEDACSMRWTSGTRKRTAVPA